MCDEIKSLSDQLEDLKRQIETGSQSAEALDGRVRDMETAVAGALAEATQKLQTMVDALPSSEEAE